MLSILLLLKAIYSLLLCYFELPFLISNPLKFLALHTLFNYIFTFLLFKASVFEGKRLLAAVGGCWFLVIVAGGSPFKLNSFMFSLFLSSSLLNCPFDTRLISQVYELQLLKLAKKTPLSLTLALSTLGCLIGALISSLVVILDWNATWQHFPIPNTIGALFGEACGLVVALLICIVSNYLE